MRLIQFFMNNREGQPWNYFKKLSRPDKMASWAESGPRAGGWAGHAQLKWSLLETRLLVFECLDTFGLSIIYTRIGL